MHARFIVMFIMLAAGVAGCDKEPSQDNATKLKQAGAARAAQGSEPVQNTITVIAPPSAPQQLARREATVTAEHGKTGARVHDLMKGYAQSLGDAKSEQQYRKQLAEQLEIYKRQSLELFKLQQRAAREAKETGGAEMQQFNDNDTAP
jgi:hypothetical protein